MQEPVRFWQTFHNKEQRMGSTSNRTTTLTINDIKRARAWIDAIRTAKRIDPSHSHPLIADAVRRDMFDAGPVMHRADGLFLQIAVQQHCDWFVVHHGTREPAPIHDLLVAVFTRFIDVTDCDETIHKHRTTAEAYFDVFTSTDAFCELCANRMFELIPLGARRDMVDPFVEQRVHQCLQFDTCDHRTVHRAMAAALWFLAHASLSDAEKRAIITDRLAGHLPLRGYFGCLDWIPAIARTLVEDALRDEPLIIPDRHPEPEGE
ncbi:MAG: hypothetical protein Q7T01_01840 [bacterium]|nr:hypothetical protein [bacterium]